MSAATQTATKTGTADSEIEGLKSLCREAHLGIRDVLSILRLRGVSERTIGEIEGRLCILRPRLEVYADYISPAEDADADDIIDRF